jgi:hypothetical protein
LWEKRGIKEGNKGTWKGGKEGRGKGGKEKENRQSAVFSNILCELHTQH